MMITRVIDLSVVNGRLSRFLNAKGREAVELDGGGDGDSVVGGDAPISLEGHFLSRLPAAAGAPRRIIELTLTLTLTLALTLAARRSLASGGVTRRVLRRDCLGKARPQSSCTAPRSAGPRRRWSLTRGRRRSGARGAACSATAPARPTGYVGDRWDHHLPHAGHTGG